MATKFFDICPIDRWGLCFLPLKLGWIVMTLTNRAWRKWSAWGFVTEGNAALSHHIRASTTLGPNPGEVTCRSARGQSQLSPAFQPSHQHPACEWRSLQMIPASALEFSWHLGLLDRVSRLAGAETSYPHWATGLNSWPTEPRSIIKWWFSTTAFEVVWKQQLQHFDVIYEF